MKAGKWARMVGLLALGLSVALAATACTAPSENESCSEFGAALTASSTDIVNAFALLDSNPDEAIVQLEKTRSSFNETRDGWASNAEAGASTFDAALKALIDATATAADGEEIDASAVQEAVATFEEQAASAADACQETVETPSG